MANSDRGEVLREGKIPLGNEENLVGEWLEVRWGRVEAVHDAKLDLEDGELLQEGGRKDGDVVDMASRAHDQPAEAENAKGGEVARKEEVLDRFLEDCGTVDFEEDEGAEDEVVVGEDLLLQDRFDKNEGAKACGQGVSRIYEGADSRSTTR